MATVKKCDRCGEFYERNYFRTGALSTGLYVVGIKYVWNDNDESDTVELCDTCQRKLDEFMKGDNHEKA